MSKNQIPRLWRRCTKKKFTQWGSHILMSILMSHMMVTKNPQNVHRKYFWAILLTFIFDIKIDINICEPHYLNLFFLWTSSIVCMFDFLIFDILLTTWHLFDILTHQLNLNHLSPHRAIFSHCITDQLPVLFQNIINVVVYLSLDLRSYSVWRKKWITYMWKYVRHDESVSIPYGYLVRRQK